MGIAVGSIQYLPKGVVKRSLNEDPAYSTIGAETGGREPRTFGQVTVPT